MAWVKTFNLFIRSSFTQIKEKIENPERLIHQLIIDMEEELESVKSAVAEAMADEIQLHKKVAKAQMNCERWFKRAENAVKFGDEDSARVSLSRKIEFEKERNLLQKEHEQQRKETEKLQRSVRELESKLRQARQKRTLLLARLARSESSRKIHRAMENAGDYSAFNEFRKLEEKVERSEARLEALAKLDGTSLEPDEIEEEWNKKEEEEKLNEEYSEMKKRLDAMEEAS